MALTTGGTTYVTSTDLVANYPTASLALANRVDVVASGGPNSIKTAGYTITLADILGGNKFLYNSASPGTFTLPTSGLVDGMVVNVAQIGAAALTVSGGTIVGTTVTTAQYQGLSLVYVASGTTWYSVNSSPSAGLSIVSPTSIANSGGSASASGGAVTFTGVSSISLNGIFTSTYPHYRIMVALTGSTDMDLSTRLRASATDDSSATYSYRRVSAQATYVTQASTTSTFCHFGVGRATNASSMTADYINPQAALQTGILVQAFEPTGILDMTGCTFRAATQFDGLSLYTSAGTISGTIRAYGYRNA